MGGTLRQHALPEAPGRRATLAVTLLFLLLTVAFTWPLVWHLADTLPDWGDSADEAWRIGVIAQQVLHDPLHLYRTQAFYPVTDGLARDELLTGQGLLAAPLLWLTHNPPLAFNLLNLLSYVLSGLAMWLLVRDLTGSAAAGLVAGMIFAFSPWHADQYPWISLGAQQWMVFALLYLRYFLRHSGQTPHVLTWRASRDLALFACFTCLQALVAGYYAFFEAILLGSYLVYYTLAEAGTARWLARRLRSHRGMEPRPDWRRLGQQCGLLAAAGLLAGAVLAPFVWPFVIVQRASHFTRSLAEASFWSAAPVSLLLMGARSWLYTPLQLGFLHLHVEHELTLYPGVIASGLALLGLALPRRGAGNAGRWWCAGICLTGLLLSFGPTLKPSVDGSAWPGFPLPYAWLYGLVPGFDALRVPARFGELFMLGLAGCAGYGIAHLAQLGTRRYGAPALTAGILALIALEYWAPTVPMTATPTAAAAPPVYRWLASPAAARVVPAAALVLELPIGDSGPPIDTNPIYLLYGLAHGHPLLNGSANILPAGYDRLYYEMRRFPTPATLDLAEGLGVQYLIVHTAGLISGAKQTALFQEATPGGRLEEIARFPEFPPVPGVWAILYRLRPGHPNTAALAAAIPPGADVLLGDDPAHRRLYTTVLPLLLGPGRHYYVGYKTVYDALMGPLLPAEPNHPYPYAILYRDSGALLTRYGYGPADLVSGAANDVVQVYHRK